ncbi:MAG TPA: dihydrolipoyl dehydrogenase [Armatimonadota bacterium]
MDTTISHTNMESAVAAPQRSAAVKGRAETAPQPLNLADIQAEAQAILQEAAEVNCDIAIVGGGPGGYVAAIRAAQLGAKTVLIEGQYMGGTCLNVGCIPTKCLLGCVEAYEAAKNGKEMGVLADNVRADWPAMLARTKKIVDGLVKGVDFLMKKNGVQVIQGMADFEDAHTLTVGGRRVKAKSIILATGSKVVTFDLPGVGADYITSDTALQMETLPKSMVILGGGVIGMEWGFIYQSLGVQVTVVELLPKILTGVEQECADELTKVLKKMGIKFHLETKLVRAEPGEGGLKNYIAQTKDGKEISIPAEKLFMAVGRRPNLTMDFEKVGVKVERGFVVVDDHLRTNVPGVFAIGDLSGLPLLAHKASDEGIVAVENAMGHDRAFDRALVPSAIYTSPEVASVGMTEEEAKAAGHEVKVGKFSFRPLGKAQAINQRVGFVKWIADAKYGQVLGCHIIGPHADDLIAEATLAIAAEATIETVAHTIHAHPSLPEAMMEAALAAIGEGIHS